MSVNTIAFPRGDQQGPAVVKRPAQSSDTLFGLLLSLLIQPAPDGVTPAEGTEVDGGNSESLTQEESELPVPADDHSRPGVDMRLSPAIMLELVHATTYVSPQGASEEAGLEKSTNTLGVTHVDPSGQSTNTMGITYVDPNEQPGTMRAGTNPLAGASDMAPDLDVPVTITTKNSMPDSDQEVDEQPEPAAVQRPVGQRTSGQGNPNDIKSFPAYGGSDSEARPTERLVSSSGVVRSPQMADEATTDASEGLRDPQMTARAAAGKQVPLVSPDTPTVVPRPTNAPAPSYAHGESAIVSSDAEPIVQKNGPVPGGTDSTTPPVGAAMSRLDGQVRASSDGASVQQGILDRVVEGLQHTVAAGRTSVRLRLEPESLGRVDVQLIQRGGLLTVRFSATSQAAHDALEGGLQQLQRSLIDNGIQVQRIHVDRAVDTTQPSARSFGDSISEDSSSYGEGKSQPDFNSEHPAPSQGFTEVDDDWDNWPEPASPEQQLQRSAMSGGIDFRV